MKRVIAAFTVVALSACGPRIRPNTDAGTEDAGVDAGVDAGRPRGDDPLPGWSTAVPLPGDAGAGSLLGVSVASAPDQFGQPLIAGLFVDPNDDGNLSDTRVFFTRWDGVAKAFEEAKQIEIVGGIASGHPHRQVSVARDNETGRIALAYAKVDGVRFAWSDDDGANFSLSNASDVTAARVSSPSLALKGDVAHLAWTQGSLLVYRKRSGAGAWVEQQPSGGALALNGPVSLALDSAGEPGVAYFQSTGGAAELVFWRPGSAPVVIASSNGLDVSALAVMPSVTLTFVGTIAHVAFHLRRVAPGVPVTGDGSDELFYSVALDAAGSSWKAPVAIPRNTNGLGGYQSTGWYQGLAVDANGRVTIAADFRFSGGVSQCGGPKFARADNGTSFTTCAPMASPIQTGGEWLSMWPHKPGKQTLIFHYDQRANANLKPGVVMWREP